MQRMTPPTDELAALRARAYGPAADIHDDPDALARLRALEAAARPAPPAPATRGEEGPGDPARLVKRDESAAGGAAGSDPGAPAVPDTRRSAALDAASPDGSAGQASTVAPRSPRRIPRAWLVVWAASIALVAVVTGAIVFSLASIRPVSAATGATQVATLDEPMNEADVAWLKRMFGGNETVAFEYLGLAVALTPLGIFGSAEGPCLTVSSISDFSETDDGGGYSYTGQMYNGCGAGSFPAAAQLVVGPGSPDELRERFPDGTALSFVADGDVIGVFMAEPEAPSPAPA